MEAKNVIIGDNGLLRGMYMNNNNSKMILRSIDVEELIFLHGYHNIMNKLYDGCMLKIVKENSYVTCVIGKEYIDVNKEYYFEELCSTSGLNEEVLLLKELNNKMSNSIIKRVCNIMK